MSSFVLIKNKIKSFNKKIFVSADKSLSIRWVLLAAQATGKSRAYNLLESEDVNSALKALKKLGIKINKTKKFCEINGKGLNSFLIKKNTTINAGNSGTFSRIILGVLAKSDKTVKLIGDKSLSRRDFSRVIDPLRLFGINIKSNKNKLPIEILGSKFLRPINYFENKGSAQCKSCVMFAALNTPGITKIKAKKSRDHTENFFKTLKLPIKIKKEKKFDFIEIIGQKNYKGFNYNIPSDISSSAFFIALTLLSEDSKILIKNANINKSRTGIIDILNKMNAKIRFKNKKIYKGEKIADIFVRSCRNLKSINCPSELNSRAIDEFLIIFLAASKAKGVSYFRNLSELNQKESPRLKVATKILRMMGVKIISTNKDIKIYGNPNLNLNKNYVVKNFMKDHRVFMMSCIAALSLGGKWKIYDKDSIKTSFPKFFSLIKSLGGKINQ